jgi:large subunit ribosomal protein L15
MKGIAGGMSRARHNFVVVNIGDLEQSFDSHDVVSIENLKNKRILNSSGRDRKLPVKVLGRGSLSKPLTVHAAAFSSSAKAKIAEAGGLAEIIL